MPDFDIASIENMDSLSILHFLILNRLFYTSRLDAAEEKVEQASLAHPINPLLLASAISMSLLKKQDYQSFLSRYISGVELIDLEEKLLILPSFEDEESLSTFLHIETDFVQSFYLLSLASMLPAPQSLQKYYTEILAQPDFEPFPEKHASIIAMEKLGACMQTAQYHLTQSSKKTNSPSDFSKYIDINEKTKTSRVSAFLSECWEYLKELELPQDWSFDRFIVLYYAWILANPVFLTMGYGGEPSFALIKGFHPKQIEGPHLPQKFLFAKLLAHGYTVNSAIHNARELYEYQLNKVKGDYNTLLRSTLTQVEKKETLMDMRKKLSNAEGLVKRSFRLYEWIPSEIAANQGTEMKYREYIKNMATTKFTTDYTSLEKDGQEPFPFRSVTYGE